MIFASEHKSWHDWWFIMCIRKQSFRCTEGHLLFALASSFCLLKKLLCSLLCIQNTNAGLTSFLCCASHYENLQFTYCNFIQDLLVFTKSDVFSAKYVYLFLHVFVGCLTSVWSASVLYYYSVHYVCHLVCHDQQS